MSRDSKAIFFLTHNNSVDQITPIIYKLAERGKMMIDVVLWFPNEVADSDYRIEILREYENVSLILQYDNVPDQRTQFVERLKDIGRAIPSNIPKKLYESFISATESPSTEVIDLTNSLIKDYDSVVVGMEWTFAKSHMEQLSALKDRDTVTTVVLPHGDAPFWNSVIKPRKLSDLLYQETVVAQLENKDDLEFPSNSNESIVDQDWFSEPVNLWMVSYVFNIGVMTWAYDYFVSYNHLLSRRIEPFVNKDKIKQLGSPRYNREWLDIISRNLPENQLPSTDKTRVVLFNRDEGYFVSKQEIKNTIRLVSKFQDYTLIVKEHPRKPIFSETAEIRDLSNVEVVGGEIQSVALVDWGDVFLSLGTSIIFEPIMRSKPVLSLDYAHANYTTVSHYLSASDIRSKDDLYHTLHSLKLGDTSDFYDVEEREHFIQEMVTDGRDSVLDMHADFIQSCIDA